MASPWGGHLCRNCFYFYFSEEPRGTQAPVPGTHFLIPDVSWEPGEVGTHRQAEGRALLAALAVRYWPLRVSCPFTQTIKPWQEGDRVWVSWTQAFNINVTKELLKKINFHKITLKVWDTKEKVSKRVKYYRLKPSGFMEDMGSFGKSGVWV